MIISKAPFRVSLFGGSTDYKEFYEKHESLIISFAINKYNYISLRKTPPIQPYHHLLQYSKVEILQKRDKIEHNGIRGVLDLYKINYGIELSSMADVTKMSGLGTSSSYIVNLIKAIDFLHHGDDISPKYLAEMTNRIEREILQEPGGYQDPYPAAYGGFNSLSFGSNSCVVKPMPLCREFIDTFIDHSLMLYIGGDRKSFEIASSHSNDDAKIKIGQIAREAYKAFCNEDIKEIGKLLNTSWEHKKSLSSKISSSKIDEIYKRALDSGAWGGKLLGAGGTGFLYLVCNPTKKKNIINDLNLFSLDFNIDWDGCKIINYA